jgi:serine/threonine protein kinase
MPAFENLVNKTEWSSLTGLILDGGYEMKEPLELEEASALFKIRVLGGWGQEALVRLYHADLAQAEEQLSFWQTLREWPHPNVSTPLAAGYRWLGDVGVVYIVLPIPDEKLSSVLVERPLTEGEATEVVRNIASGLGHLHACGLMHGSIAPETVLAIANAMQVSVESVRRQGADLLVSPPRARYLAPESVDANVTTAADMWCLGATLFEALSQRRYDAFSRDRIKSLPFSWLLQKCLEESPDVRCNLTEALSIFARGPKAAPPPPKPVVAEPVAPPPVVPETVAAEPIVSAPVAGERIPEAAGEAPATMTKSAAEPVAPAVEPPVRPTIRQMPAAKVPDAAKPASDVAQPAEPIREEEKPAAASTTTGAAARVAAADEARKAAATGDAFKKASSASSGTSSILSAPLPTESRHKPAEMKRKPVAAKIRHIGSTGLGLSDAADENTGSADKAVTRISRDPKPWEKSKPRTWQLAVAGSAVLIMLLAVIFLVVVPRLQSPNEPAGPVQGPSAPAGSKGNAWQTKTLAPPQIDANAARPPAGAAARSNSTPAEIAGGQADNGNNNWRLVLYSYKYKQDAERRIVLLKRTHPTLDARLFVPVRKWPFMVVLGGPTSKENADELKKLAIAQGMPRAIYVQRF